MKLPREGMKGFEVWGDLERKGNVHGSGDLIPLGRGGAGELQGGFGRGKQRNQDREGRAGKEPKSTWGIAGWVEMIPAELWRKWRFMAMREGEKRQRELSLRVRAF